MAPSTPLDRLDLNRLVDASPHACVLLDAAGRIVGANPACQRSTGRGTPSLLGQRFFDAFPSDPESVGGRALRRSLDRTLATGHCHPLSTLRYPVALADGPRDERCWNITPLPLAGADGTVGCVLVHWVEVSDPAALRARASGSATASEDGARHPTAALQADAPASDDERADLRRLFDQAPGFMSVLRGPDHVFEIANQACMRLVGGRALIGRPVREALPELAPQGFVALLDQVYASGEPYIAHGMPAQLQRAPGTPLEQRHVDFVFQPLEDDQGRVRGIFVQGHDVTSIALAHEAAQASERRFRTLAHSLPNQVWTARPDGSVDWFNQQVRDYAGVDEGMLRTQGWSHLVHADDAPRVRVWWHEALRNATPYHAEFRIRRHDGVYRWHIARALPMRDARGDLTQWIGTNTDIEDQKAGAMLLADLNNQLARRVEERSAELMRLQETLRQSQKMEAIGNLAGGIAHDFNNLLQVIGGNLAMLQDKLPAAERARLAHHIDAAQGGVARGARLASQLLAFGRRQPLAPELVDIGSLVRAMEPMLRGALGEAVQVNAVVDPGLWTTLVDPVNVENALLNLALNARDAMHGHGSLTITAGNLHVDEGAPGPSGAAPGDYVTLAVSDTGHGMSAEVLAKAFEPFFSTKPDGKGTGLGLSMVYGFVSQSGGHVTIDSAPGRGTTVRIVLPRSLDALPPRSADIPAPGWVGGSERVLVAEDDEAVRDTTVALLGELGYRVLQAGDAQAAMALIDSGEPVDLLLTDVVMPGPMKSTELARLARQRRPGLAVLFTSGYSASAIVHDGRLDPGVQLLSKPYTRQTLARKLRQVLGRGSSVDATVPSPQPAESSAGAPAADGPGAVMTPLPSSPSPTSRPAPEGEPPAAAAACLRVLVCEDDDLVRQALCELLVALDCEVFEAGTAAQARRRLAAGTTDLLLTDLGLPDGDGLSLAAWARDRQPGLALVIASGDDVRDALGGLPGALALRKPFDLDDLSGMLDSIRARGPVAGGATAAGAGRPGAAEQA